MFRLLLYFLVLKLSYSTCPPEFELVRDGQCRGLYDSIGTSWDQATKDAVALCSQVQGEPVIIHTDEQYSYWIGQAKDMPAQNYVIGLQCNVVTMKWEWADGSQVDYKPPSGNYHPGLNSDCKPGCMWLLYYPDINNHVWDMFCGTKHYEPAIIFCTVQLEILDKKSDECDSFENDEEDGVCYQIGRIAESWRDASAICKDFGAEMASIHNVKENSFIRRLAASKGEVQGIFLGAMGETEFMWIDGTPWDYNNFYPGFPVMGLGNCLAMDTQGTTGDWVNTDCSAKLSVACVRPQNVSARASCSSGPWKEGEPVYSPGFPYDASTPCDFVFGVPVGKKIKLEIVLLEANSCCDKLVIFDNYIAGQVIAELTGSLEAKTYTSDSNFMRVSWQPNGAVNVRGVMMTYHAV